MPIHVDVARSRAASGAIVSSGQLCTVQPRSSLGSPTVPISQSTMAASARRRAVLVHDVGELVVAVHEPRDVVDRAVRPEPGRGLVEAGQLAALDPLEEGGPAVDLALVEAVGAAEVLEALGLPVDVGQQGDALDQLVGEPGPGLEVGVERRRPLAVLQAHRRPAVDEAHQVEGPAQHRGVGTDGDGPRVRHVGAVSASMMRHSRMMPVVPGLRRAGRRDAQGAVQVAPADLVDLVLGAAGDEAALDRLALSGDVLAVQP